MVSLLGYGGGAPVTPCDLDFIADQAGDANGVDTRPGNEAGTVLNASATWTAAFGSEYALASLGAGFLQIIAVGLIDQNVFATLTVDEWGETFASGDATYFQDAGSSFWIWFTNVNEFNNGDTYCVTLT